MYTTTYLTKNQKPLPLQLRHDLPKRARRKRLGERRKQPDGRRAVAPQEREGCGAEGGGREGLRGKDEADSEGQGVFI